jgi:hypothetical protein
MGHHARAYLCKFYDLCLHCAAVDGHDTIPCEGCEARYDLAPWKMENQDLLGYYLLLAEIFYPGSLYRIFKGRVSDRSPRLKL